LHKSIKKDFLRALSKKAKELSIGVGMDNPDLGPLVSYDQYQRVTGFIESGIKEGASLVMGGKRPDQLKKGYFVQPTIFERVKTNMRIAQQEIFGPVVVALEFEDEDEAIQISNGVAYGLVGGVYTKDISRAFRVARRLRTGSVWINGWYMGGVQAPTGGTKESGFGRERGLAGIHNYLQTKNIGIRL